MSKKRTYLGMERQSELQKVLYMFRNNENTLSEINNNFLEVLSQILKYQHAQNQGYVKIQTSLIMKRQSHLPHSLIHPQKQ